jgi:hypothetical protein
LSSLQYQYSNLAAWSGPSGSGRAFGFTAFGVPTQASAVPRTGSGAYSGFVEGYSTVMTAWDNETFNAGIEGTVDLNFDFGAGTLSGQIKPVHYVDDKSPLPTLAFTNTVYSVGSQSFSGQFATNLPGANAFSGQFTGPQAEELIGKFAFPFIYSKDGTVQQATGAMIAKR